MTFDQFWQQYPRKVARKPARQVWDKLSPEDQAKALIGVKTYAKACAGKEKQFILHAKTYLNQERWDDELELPEKTDAERWIEALYDNGSGGSSTVRRDADGLRVVSDSEEVAGSGIAGSQNGLAEATIGLLSANNRGGVTGHD